MDDSLNNMIKKLKQRGDVSEERIAELEASLKNKVQNTLSVDLESRLKFLEEVVNSKMTDEVKRNSGKWVVPFVLLVIVIVVVMAVSYVRQWGRCECRTNIGICRRRMCCSQGVCALFERYILGECRIWCNPSILRWSKM